MKLVAPLILLGLAVALGLCLGYRYLQRERNRPALIAFHILPGLAALELIAMLLRGAPDESGIEDTALAKATALMLVFAAIVGVLTPLLARDRPRLVATAALSLHALLAFAAFALLIAWAASA